MLYLYRLLVATAAVLVIQKACTGKHESKPVQFDVNSLDMTPDEIGRRIQKAMDASKMKLVFDLGGEKKK